VIGDFDVSSSSSNELSSRFTSFAVELSRLDKQNNNNNNNNNNSQSRIALIHIGMYTFNKTTYISFDCSGIILEIIDQLIDNVYFYHSWM
jgi:hypothetical protein